MIQGRMIDRRLFLGTAMAILVAGRTATAFATGQAAGVAAATFVEAGQSDGQAVRRVLIAQGALIDAAALR
jgi:hypothetical protein